MAKIVELKRAANATLGPGAVQNWDDLRRPAGSTPLLRTLVRQTVQGARSCLIAGPHDPELVAEVARIVPETTVHVRSIPDSHTLGEAAPTARVLCGQFPALLEEGETFDVVVALDDVTRLQSLECDPVTWESLARDLVGRVGPAGRLLFAIENELGLQRRLGAEDQFLTNRNADWAPYWTYDATRPRTREQVADRLTEFGGAGATGRVLEAFPDWRSLGAVVDMDAAPAPIRTILGAIVVRPVTAPYQGADPLPLVRSLSYADRLGEACAGWLVTTGLDLPAPGTVLEALADGTLVTWAPEGGESVVRTIGDDSIACAVAAPDGSLAARLVVAAVDGDTPAMRRLLAQWSAWLDTHTDGGMVDAGVSDSRFGNVWPEGEWTTLIPGTEPLPREEVVWTALGDFQLLMRARGIRPPWPKNMDPLNVLELLGAMAGETPPGDVSSYVLPFRMDALYTADRAELIATIKRLEEQMRILWARWHWDERRYLTHRSVKFAKRAAKKVVKTSKQAARKVASLPGRVSGPAQPDTGQASADRPTTE
jgi:hypothetical protein